MHPREHSRREAGLANADRSGLTTAVARTALGLLSAQGVTWTTALVNIMLLPRFLGVTSYGLIATVWVISEIVATLAVFGSDNYVVRTAARRPQLTSTLVATAIALRLALWAVVMSALVGGLALVGVGSTLLLAFAAAFISGCAGLVHRANVVGLQANLRLARLANIAAVTAIGGQVVGVAVLVVGGGLLGLLYTAAGMQIILAAISTVYFWMRFPPPNGLSASGVVQLARDSRHFLSWDMALLLFSRVDIVMLAVMAGGSVVGNYSFAYRLLAVPGVVFTIVVSAVYPALAQVATRDREWFVSTLTQTGRLAVVTALPMAVGVAVVSSDLVELLGDGEFGDARLLIVLLAGVVPLAALGTVLGVGLWSLDRQRSWALVAWTAVALNTGGNLFAIPAASAWFGSPASGAALITLLTELFMCVWAWRLIGSEVDRTLLIRAIAVALACSAAMAVCVLALPASTALVLKIVAGVVSYSLAVGFTRLIAWSDIAFFWEAFRRREVALYEDEPLAANTGPGVPAGRIYE